MGVIRVHAILPVRKDLFLLSKLAVFLLSDLAFAVLLTLLNVGLNDGAAVLATRMGSRNVIRQNLSRRTLFS